MATLAVAVLLTVTGSIALAVGRGNVIRSKGDESFERNVLVQATFRWDPEIVDVKTGHYVKFVYDNEGHDPHTISIVSRSQRPNTVEQVFNCRVCNKIFRILDGHQRTDLDGDGGLNKFGDNILLLPGQSAVAKVTAPAGSTLYYMCAIHPWMQGKIIVTGS